MSEWLRCVGRGDEAGPYAAHAGRVREAFNRRFWNPKREYLFGVIDGEEGDDPSCRPNQIFAIALPHPVLEERYWPAVLRAVQQQLLTPYGLRSLSPEHPDYQPRYYGDLRARDAAYHQGTIWPWLLGPYIDAWLRVSPAETLTAQRLVGQLLEHLDSAGVGSVSEIFDATPPCVPRIQLRRHRFS